VQIRQPEASVYYPASRIRAHVSTEAVSLAPRDLRINRKR
jgi:hypothetical protein